METLKLSQFNRSTGVSENQATLLLGGDLCPIGRYEKKILQGESVFDADLQDVFRKNDFCIVNLEAPLCAMDLPCNNPGERGLRANPEIAGYLNKLGVTAVSLANNHIRDFGDEGYRQTAASLDRHHVLHTGAGKNLAEAQQPLIVTVKGIRLGIWALAEKELNVAEENAAGSSWFRPDENYYTIQEMRKKVDFLLVYVHAGHEFMSTPSPRIRAAYRRFVDAGADAVIGHHPHVVQGAERYKDALIAYSLGNLLFDSPYVSAHPNTDLGYLLRLRISPHRVVAAELIPYKLREQTIATVLDSDEWHAFSDMFKTLSDNILDEGRFLQEWAANVTARWQGEFKGVINSLASGLQDVTNLKGPRRAKNLITCPTHVELLAKVFDMMEAGQLPRQ